MTDPSEPITDAELAALASTRTAPGRPALLHDFPALASELERRQAERAHQAAVAEQTHRARNALQAHRVAAAHVKATTVRTTAQPRAADDAAILLYGGTSKGLIFSDNPRLELGAALQYVSAADLETVLATGSHKRHHERLRSRHLLICRKPVADLLATIRAAIVDPLHDCDHPRRPTEIDREHDEAMAQTMLAEVVNSMGKADAQALIGWYEAAAGAPHAQLFRSRLVTLFGDGVLKQLGEVA